MNQIKNAFKLAPLLFFTSIITAGAQKVTYTDPDKNELKQTEFEIIGKYNGNFLIYKNNKNSLYISVYDGDLKLKENVALTNITERITNSDIIAYPDFSYLFYQYQRKGTVYCMLLKIGPDGKSLTKPIELDTTHVGGMGGGDRQGGGSVCESITP